MRYLFLVSIGPVQDFIASARRSRDLWFGSWILSELSKAAANTIAHWPDARIIFPAPTGDHDLEPDSPFNVANKLLAILPGAPGNLPAEVKKAIDERLEAIARDAFAKVDGDFDEARAWRQVRDLVEYYWAAAPLESEDKYARERAYVEALLAARKATRDFAASSWDAAIPKSSLDGQRESVIPKDAYDRLTPQELYHQYGVRRGEQLDGVGLLKRHGYSRRQPGIFSTSHVAALPLIARIPVSASGAVTKYIVALRQCDVPEEAFAPVLDTPHGAWQNYDGHLLFEERLAEWLEGEPLARARGHLKAFLDNTVAGQRPDPYYALLHADGDRMGKAIDRITDEDTHRMLSKALAEFAVGVRKTVTGYDGSLVYSGGDDVLAFLPLHRVLACAAKLASDFRAALHEYVTDLPGVTPTLSVGIAITHHIEPLSDALELAGKAEHEAKRTRNALAITVSKRSGADRTVSGPWGSLDHRLNLFVRLHRLDAVPDGAAYDLQNLAWQLGGPTRKTDDPDLLAAMRREAVRILKRKQPAHGTAKKIVDETLNALATKIDRPDPKTGILRPEVSALADELIVARLFAAAEDLAGMPKPEKEVVA